jgi:hypothetical protein
MRRAILGVIVVGVLMGSSWVAGRQSRPYPVPVEPSMLSGNDIGFRVEGTMPGGVVGRLMVRLKTGEWVEAHAAPSRGRLIPLDRN